MFHRSSELGLLVCRILLGYLFFTLSRILFIYFNDDIISVSSFSEVIQLCYYGLRFDTTSILYLISPFILMSIFSLDDSAREPVLLQIEKQIH